MKIFRKQSGASLLIILLIMAGAGAVVLVGSKAMIDSTRQASASASNGLALQMAQNGIQDGLQLIKKGFLPTSGEYGNPTAVSGYSLQPMRRGFSDADCTTLGADIFASANTNLTYTSDCPYYDFTVRNIIALSSATTDYSLTTRELPNGIATVIPVPVNPGIHVTINGVPGLTFDYEFCSTLDCGNVADLIVGSTHTAQSGSFDITGTYNLIPVRAVRLTSHYGFSAGAHVVIVGSVAPISGWQQNGGPQIAIGKGYTTVDVTGYAGGVQKKLILTVRKHDKLTLEASEINPSYNVLDFSGSFDQYGVLIP